MNVDVDGFDFDKFAPLSPQSKFSDSLRDLPPDVWSPAGKMAISPLQGGRKTVSIPLTAESMPTPDEIEVRESPVYGTNEDIDRMLENDKKPPAINRHANGLENMDRDNEKQPLLPPVPREIVANNQGHPPSYSAIDELGQRGPNGTRNAADTVGNQGASDRQSSERDNVVQMVCATQTIRLETKAPAIGSRPRFRSGTKSLRRRSRSRSNCACFGYFPEEPTAFVLCLGTGR